jgi:oligopeptide transport system substrate-binding protein
MRRARALGVSFAIALPLAGLASCTNNPYPEADDLAKVRYSWLGGPPKDLDPAVTYNVSDHAITANVYETLLEYHYLKRPYELMPGLAEAVPKAESRADGRVTYRFKLRPGARYQPDPCFALGAPGSADREIVAADVAFELMRIGDPTVISPVVATFEKIEGFDEFTKRLVDLRKADPGFAKQRIDRQYEAAGGVSGLVVRGRYELDVILRRPYPQLLYWFAMPFTSPVPWEAVAYYNGEGGRPFFTDHPVASGPFRITRYEKYSRITLERNPNWYGALHPEWRAPGAVYPSAGEKGDAEAGLLRPEYVGRPLPFIDRIEFRMEKESIPAFNKFLQGYYDASGIIQESFDRAVQQGRLSPEMEARGMALAKSVDPAVYYMGFNMNDPTIGARAGERGRKLRQALSSAVDVVEYCRIFMNGRGVPAQSVLPPGIFGFAADYQNPFRTPDPDRARALLAEAGYKDGIDPQTRLPLRLTLDTPDPSTRGRLQWQFFVDAWRRIGLDVQIAATNYNAYQDKLRDGAYQIYFYGWVADYPDPENFLFLLWGPNANAKNPGAPNVSNFADPRFDALFLAMKDMPNGPERQQRIVEMRGILERERPWIELFYPESYALFHGWNSNVKPPGLSLPTAKYVDVDPELRRARRVEWNHRILWPAWVFAAAFALIAAPGVATYLRERQ